EQHDPNVRVGAGSFERVVEFINSAGAKRVAHLWPVERDAGDFSVTAHMRGDVGVAAVSGRFGPHRSIKKFRNDAHEHPTSGHRRRMPFARSMLGKIE